MAERGNRVVAMTHEEATVAVKRIRELEAVQEEIAAEMEALKDGVKAFLTEQGTDEMRLAGYKVKYMRYTTYRFDSKKFRIDHEETYNEYLKASPTARFTIS